MGCNCGGHKHAEHQAPSYSAFGLKGSYDIDAKKREIENHGFFAKLKGIKVGKIIETETHVAIIEPKLETLKKEFLNFIHKKCPEPWSSTEYILSSYLSMRSIPEFIIQEVKNDQANEDWVFAAAFNSCGEASSVSSMVALHWFAAFTIEEHSKIKEILASSHFRMNETIPEPVNQPVFLPLKNDGYVKFHDKSHCENDSCGCENFDFDETVYNQISDETLHALNTHGVEIMKDGKCKCQICSPDFDLNKIDML